jgi:hypothetical protein
LHATDPASVYLSVLARSAESTLSDVADAMYARRSLVRWMAMRRTPTVASFAPPRPGHGQADTTVGNRSHAGEGKAYRRSNPNRSNTTSPAAGWSGSGRRRSTTCSGGPNGARTPPVTHSRASRSRRSTCRASLGSSSRALARTMTSSPTR